jgi:glycosyltransferase involved in cell wall biosynthesis
MVPSHAQLRDTTRSHLLRRSRVHVVPNGIDATTFSPGDRDAARRELGLAPGLMLTWIGRMYPGKGVDLAIEALARSGVDASLLLVGDGESRHDLECLATSTGLGSRVVFAGSQPREQLPSYLRASDVLVFPSRVPEAAGLAALQAMACGIPVIAAASGALPELVGSSGSAGELVSASDVSELSRAIARLATDEARRSEMGHAGRQRVLAEYTIDRMVERTLRVYAIAAERFRTA